jgi:serine/threonine protein phosphatase PrpC
LFAVADGMGGYEGGEVASRVTVDTITAFLSSNVADREITWPFSMDRSLSYVENLLGVAVRLAHERICERKQGRLSRMGSTVAALVLTGEVAVTAHVGDSRVYRLRHGQLVQLTRDHSLVAEMRSAGMTVDSAPFRNVVTRALGTPCAEPEVRTHPLLAGDRYLLCTDGLVERLDDDSIREVLAGSPPQLACSELVQRAFDAGARDNITAVVVEVEQCAARAARAGAAGS